MRDKDVLLDKAVRYFESGPESLKYPGMGDEKPLWDLLEEIEKNRPGFINSLMIR